jgi:pyruvate dehydrogenase E2 component (dihydrolipoamide acetyltransferase)
MSIEVKVPNLGDGIDSGDVLNVLVGVGDVIEAEQGIVELETDKAVAEVPSPQAGRVTEVHVASGQTVPIGLTLITLEPVEAGEGAAEAEAPPAAEPPQQEEDAEVASAGEASADTSPVEPATAPPPLPAVTPETPAPPVSAAAPEKADQPKATSVAAPAGPSVRRFARELGIDLSHVPGSGPGGRITRDDVLAAVRSAATQASAGVPAAAGAAALAPVEIPEGEHGSDAWGPIVTGRLSKIRTTIAANMVQSKSTAPHVTNFDDADVTELERIRQSSKADYAASGVKLTSMPFVIKAVAQALRRHPVVNASVIPEDREVIYKQYINVGVAVDTERGLIVPVLRGIDSMGIPQIARALQEISEKARAGKINVDEMRGGTFTISNLGAIGGTYSTPIINPPEVAILLVGRSRKLPIVVDDDIQVRLMMPLSLSYDHRLVDGAAAARFLNEVKDYLQAPGRLLLAP